MSAYVPLRTCVGCGTRAPQSALMRFTATAEGLRADVGRRAAGRGAYLHGVPTCWAAFVRRRGAVRSLRLTPPMRERERLLAQLDTAAATSR